MSPCFQFEASVKHEDGSVTNFLALDQFRPDRQHLEVVDIEASNPGMRKTLRYDPAWISILRATNHLIKVDKARIRLPWDLNLRPSQHDIEEVRRLLGNNLDIPLNFEATEPVFDPFTQDLASLMLTLPPTWKSNPQTQLFCAKFGLHDPIELLQGQQLSWRRPRPSTLSGGTEGSNRQELAKITRESPADAKDWRAMCRDPSDRPKPIPVSLERRQRTEPRPGTEVGQPALRFEPSPGGSQRHERGAISDSVVSCRESDDDVTNEGGGDAGKL